MEANEAVPGPGAYDGEKLKRENFAYSIGKKLSDGGSKKNSPGPGNYETRASLEGAPTTKFGTSQRVGFGSDKKGFPGPGEHSPDAAKVLKAAPKYGFGSENRNYNSN